MIVRKQRCIGFKGIWSLCKEKRGTEISHITEEVDETKVKVKSADARREEYIEAISRSGQVHYRADRKSSRKEMIGRERY